VLHQKFFCVGYMRHALAQKDLCVTSVVYSCIHVLHALTREYIVLFKQYIESFRVRFYIYIYIYEFILLIFF